MIIDCNSIDDVDCAVDDDDVYAKPFLKWAGGKKWLLPILRELRPRHIRNYHEPFLGGGSHFFDLISSGFRGKSYLSDLNEELVRTYVAIRDYPPDILMELETHLACHSEPYFYEVRSQNPNYLTDHEVAARMIYLNRAGFNGLYRVNQKGECNVPWGKRDRITFDNDNFAEVFKSLKNADIQQGDFGTVLKCAQAGDFALLDPPYPNGFTQYTSIGFDESDHRRLHEVCCGLDRKHVNFIQTNADCPFIRDLYRDFQIVPVQAPRNISCKGNGRDKVREILIMNY